MADEEAVPQKPSRRKRVSKFYYYVNSESQEADTLKDKFWRELEQGKLDTVLVSSEDLYSKVKRKKAPSSYVPVVSPSSVFDGNSPINSVGSSISTTPPASVSGYETGSVPSIQADTPVNSPNKGIVLEAGCSSTAVTPSKVSPLKLFNESSKHVVTVMTEGEEDSPDRACNDEDSPDRACSAEVKDVLQYKVKLCNKMGSTKNLSPNSKNRCSRKTRKKLEKNRKNRIRSSEAVVVNDVAAPRSNLVSEFDGCSSSDSGSGVKEVDTDCSQVKQKISSSCKRRSQTWYYVDKDSEAADTLKDKFWRDLENGKYTFEGSRDLYSTVKHDRRTKSAEGKPESAECGAVEDQQESVNSVKPIMSSMCAGPEAKSTVDHSRKESLSNNRKQSKCRSRSLSRSHKLNIFNKFRMTVKSEATVMKKDNSSTELEDAYKSDSDQMELDKLKLPCQVALRRLSAEEYLDSESGETKLKPDMANFRLSVSLDSDGTNVTSLNETYKDGDRKIVDGSCHSCCCGRCDFCRNNEVMLDCIDTNATGVVSSEYDANCDTKKVDYNDTLPETLLVHADDESNSLEALEHGVSLFDDSAATEILLDDSATTEILEDIFVTEEDKLANAVKSGDYRYLVSFLDNPEMVDSNASHLLMLAIENGHRRLVDLLIEKKVDVNACDPNGDTPLMMASRKGFDDVVTVLRDRGAHLDTSNHLGETALIVAVKGGHWRIVNQLLNMGANFASPKNDQNTSARWARINGFMEITNIINTHVKRVQSAFMEAVEGVIGSFATILYAVFPLQCFSISDSDTFTVRFMGKAQPRAEDGSGMLLFIAHAIIGPYNVSCHLNGLSSIVKVVLNGGRLDPFSEQQLNIFTFFPIQDGFNELVIETQKNISPEVKLLVHAYQVKLNLLQV